MREGNDAGSFFSSFQDLRAISHQPPSFQFKSSRERQGSWPGMRRRRRRGRQVKPSQTSSDERGREPRKSLRRDDGGPRARDRRTVLQRNRRGAATAAEVV